MFQTVVLTGFKRIETGDEDDRDRGESCEVTVIVAVSPSVDLDLGSSGATCLNTRSINARRPRHQTQMRGLGLGVMRTAHVHGSNETVMRTFSWEIAP